MNTSQSEIYGGLKGDFRGIRGLAPYIPLYFIKLLTQIETSVIINGCIISQLYSSQRKIDFSLIKQTSAEIEHCT